MSQVDHYRGTLTVVERLENESLEEQCKRLSGASKLDSWNDLYQKQLMEDDNERYVIRDDVLYSVEKKSIDYDEDIFTMTENGNGTLDFEVRYYNGGCGFGEAIKYAFKNKK